MRRELKIGIFFGGTILILAIIIFVVGDLSVLFTKPGYSLLVNVDTASGLEKRAAVRMAGVKIGYVKDIRLVQRRAQIEMVISPRYQVPRGSKAALTSTGFIGERFIEIIPGEETSTFRPGEVVEAAVSMGLDQLGGTLLSVADEIKAVGQSIREIAGENSKTSLREILQNLASFTRELDEFLGQSRGDLQTGIQHVSQTARDFDEKVKSISQNIDETVGLLKDMASENREAVKFNLNKIKELLTGIEESLRQLSETLDKINRGEGSAGKFIQDPELYQDAKETLGEARKTVGALNEMRASGSFRVDYLGRSEKVKSYITLRFTLNPRTFILGQIAEDPFLEKFTYTAQGGIRWGVLAPRAGIIESAFGAGVDILALSDRLVFSLEGFDFERDIGPRLRFVTQFSLLKYVYLVAGVDDLGRSLKREFYFGFGVGK